MKPRKVIKDFKELQPIDKRIELVANSLFYQIVFRGEANEDFRPERGTQLERVWRMKKLDERQQIAWTQFMDDVRLAAGKSGGVAARYGEATDQGSGDGFRAPTAYINEQYRRVEQLLMGFLDRHERALLIELLQDNLKGNSSLTIETIGLIKSGYSDKVSARAAGVAHCQALLNRIATFYGI